MPDRVRHDDATTSADFSRTRDHRIERGESRQIIFNVGLIPAKLVRIATLLFSCQPRIFRPLVGLRRFR
jgi:hypothetical protein